MHTKSLSTLIDSELCIRASGLGYSYSEIVENLFAIFYAGGDCIEGIHLLSFNIFALYLFF